jgi:hypothetical protein
MTDDEVSTLALMLLRYHPRVEVVWNQKLNARHPERYRKTLATALR